MHKEVKNKVEEIRKERKGRLMALALDIGYLTKMIEKQSEADLRKELEEEKGKIQKSDKGNVIADNRDNDKIVKLEATINRIASAQQERAKYIQLYNDILEYVMFIDDGMSEDSLKKMEIVALL